MPLKLNKEHYSVETAEYSKDNHIDDEPGFNWWVPYTLKKINVNISYVKVRTRKTTIKYGIKIPQNLNEAKLFDNENGNTFWQNAMTLK